MATYPFAKVPHCAYNVVQTNAEDFPRSDSHMVGSKTGGVTRCCGYGQNFVDHIKNGFIPGTATSRQCTSLRGVMIELLNTDGTGVANSKTECEARKHILVWTNS